VALADTLRHKGYAAEVPDEGDVAEL